jgi:hypothetical protein
VLFTTRGTPPEPVTMPSSSPGVKPCRMDGQAFRGLDGEHHQTRRGTSFPPGVLFTRESLSSL